MKKLFALLLCSTVIICACQAPKAGIPAAKEPVAVVEFTAEPTASTQYIDIPFSITPTPKPLATLEPTSTPAPTATPNPTAEPISFIPSQSMPLPCPQYPLNSRVNIQFDGTVKSASPLSWVRADVCDKGGKVVLSYTHELSGEEVFEYRLLDDTFSRNITAFSEGLKLNSLRAGSYGFALYAATRDGAEYELYNSTFTIENEQWITLIPNYLRTNFDTAADFMGGEASLSFRFRFTDGRRIEIEPAWTKENNSKCLALNGKHWQCHKNAVPNFETACRYLESTYICVHVDGNNASPILLADLVEMNGTSVRRFTNDGAFISHHSFGTAVDINAYYTSNKNHAPNRDKIYSAVADKLVYNGIIENNGTPCHDFTYNDRLGENKKGVPEVILNYLIYELAFYRAGFSWGIYYPHTSDAMHFTLSELSPALFESGDYAMRKVFEYIY